MAAAVLAALGAVLVAGPSPAQAATAPGVAVDAGTSAWANAAAGSAGLTLAGDDVQAALCGGTAALATTITVWPGCPTEAVAARHVVAYDIPADDGGDAFLLVVVDAVSTDAAFTALATDIVVRRGEFAAAAGLPVPDDAGEPPGGRFADDDAHVYEPFHEAVAGAGLVAGCAATSYCPDSLLRRGEMAVMLAAALALPPGGEPFGDTAGHFAADAATRLRAAGIAAGCGGNAFCPNAVLTRGEMAVLVAAALALPPGGEPFADTAGHFAADATTRLRTAGITAGCGGNAFCPDHALSRGEAAVLLTRAFGLEPDAPPPGLHPPYGDVTLVAGGDILMHTQVTAACATGAGYDCSGLFAAVAPLVEAADVALCHMEVPIAGDERGLSGYPIFNAPEALAPAVAAAGFDVCNTASNHTIDKGADGACRTTQELAAAGVASTGSACDAEQRANPPIFDVRGIRIAFLAYTYGTNGIPIPPDAPFAVNLIDPATIIADAEAARARGAEFVVVNLHHGTEYAHEPTGSQVGVVAALTASAAIDLVVGQHAHVVQPIARVNGKLVAYGEGNFVSAQSRTGTQEGLLLVVTIRRDAAGVRAVHIAYDTVYTGPGYQVIPASRADELALDAGTAAALAAARARTVAVVGSGDGWAPLG